MTLAACAPPNATRGDPIRAGGTSKPSKPSKPSRPGKASKEALFGDPSLMPTRDGERARVEIALARTIEEHLAEDPRLTAVRAHVTSASGHSGGPTQVVISFRGPQEGAQAQELRARELALGILGDPAAQVTIDRIEAPRGAQEPSPAQVRPLSIVLALVLLALGASAGISVDRLRRRRSRV
jgi:hypothetical protein